MKRKKQKVPEVNLLDPTDEPTQVRAEGAPVSFLDVLRSVLTYG